MVDDKNNVTYYEKTLKSPINESNIEWENTVWECQIEKKLNEKEA